MLPSKLLLVVLLFCFLSCANSRPQFAQRIPEFDGSSKADLDGIFRHDSNQSNRKRDSVPTDNYLRYEAVLIAGIVRLDDLFSVESLLCQQTSQGAIITVTKNSSQDFSWTNETVLVGGAEWNCTQNSQGYPVPFAARVQTRLAALSKETYLVEFIPMSSLFKHLDLELRSEEFHVQPAEKLNPSLARVMPSSVHRDRRRSTQQRNQRRTIEPELISPFDSDMFFEGEWLEVEWINIPGSTLNLVFYNTDGVFWRVDDIDVADGSFVTTIDSDWSDDFGYYLMLEYDCSSVCNTITSEFFSVNMYPAITFNSPERGRLYTPGDSVPISVEIDTSIIGPFYLSIWQQVDNSSDIQLFDTTFSSANFQVDVIVNASWESSNAYYVIVEYDCQDGWCYYQTSEYFSVISSNSPNSLQFDEPFLGAAYTGNQFIPFNLVGNFSAETTVYLIIMQRRLGWDHEKDWYYLNYTAGLDEFYSELQVDPDWEPSRRYYISAFWGCDDTTGVCTGYAESQEFSVNYALELQLNPLRSEYAKGDSVTLSWTTSEHYTDMDIQICPQIPFFPDGCTSLGIFDSYQNSVTWTVDLSIASAVWDNYFYIKYNCQYGFWCAHIQSTYFRIRDESDLLDWNWDQNNGVVEIPEQNFYHQDCTSLRAPGEYCDLPENFGTTTCQLCGMDDFDTAFDLTCHNCYAKVGVTVNQMTINVSFYEVREFTTNLTVNATSEMDLEAQFTMAYQTGVAVPLSSLVSIYTLVPVSIAGFQFYFGIYGTVNLQTTFEIEGNAQARVLATAGAAYDVFYSSTTGQYLTNSRAPYFSVTEFSMSIQASASLTVAIVPQIQLNLLTDEAVMYINAEPYLRLDLTGSLPPYEALQYGTVPLNDALVQLLAEDCWVDHWLEFGVSSGVLWNGGFNWGSSPYAFSGVLIPEFAIASGCLWPAQNQVSIPVPVRFSPASFSSYDLLTDAFTTAIVFDVADSMGIPMGAIAQVNLSNASDVNGFMVFDVFFSDTDTLLANNLTNLFLAMTEDSSSELYSPTRYVTKSATAPQSSPSPVPSATASPVIPSSSPAASASPTPSISASSAPFASISSTPSISPSTSPVAEPSSSPSSSPSNSPVVSSQSPSAPPITASPIPSSSSASSSSPLPSSSPSASPVTDSNPPSKSSNNTAIIVIGSIIAVAVVGALITGVVIFIRRKIKPAHKAFNELHDEL